MHNKHKSLTVYLSLLVFCSLILVYGERVFSYFFVCIKEYYQFQQELMVSKMVFLDSFIISFTKYIGL